MESEFNAGDSRQGWQSASPVSAIEWNIESELDVQEDDNQSSLVFAEAP